MKNWEIKFTPEAARLSSKFHPENKKLIKTALKKLQQDPNLGEDLQEELSGFKSYKINRYRILYNINEEGNAIQIYYIGYRKDVYEQFRLLLSKLQNKKMR
jgi:mRNA interferase RelE/StbE